jgi:ATP-binding cassette subfamily C (CFTR/MRP) protein 1
MKISNKTSLKIHHLLNYLRLTETRSDLKELKNLWYSKNKEKSKFNKFISSHLLLVIVRINIFGIISLILQQFFNTGMKTSQIFFLRQIILVFKNRKDPKSQKSYFSLIPTIIIYILIKVLHVISRSHIKYSEYMLGRKTSNQIASLIYEKTMTISNKGKENFNEGDIMNFIQVDTESLGRFFYYFPKTIVFPFQFSMYMYMLFVFFGKTFIFGFLTFIILMIISLIIQYFYIRNQFKYLKDKDKRIFDTSETFRFLKIIKLYNWEDDFIEKINYRREIEIKSMTKIENFAVITGFIHWSIPLLLSVVSIGSYTYFTGQILDLPNLMTSIDIFDTMSGPLTKFPVFLKSMLNAFISMNRISKFLKMENSEKYYCESNNKEISIYIKNGNFGKINIENNNKISINNNIKKYLINDLNLEIKKGELIAIIGETGSGKTCLINSLLGSIDPYFNKQNFIINGNFSYASQNPWIINETIRNNILFFQEFNSKRYEKILNLCQLETDLNYFPAGDYTEIGGNGTNISGGQKSRINLARCVYRNSDIYLLDDPISSVDAIVSQNIFDQLFVDFLKDKTRIIVTNDIKNLEKFDKIIFIERGKCIFQGEFKELEKLDFFKEFKKYKYTSKLNDNNNNNNDNEINTKINNVGNNNIINEENNIHKIKKKEHTFSEEIALIQKENYKKKGKLTSEEEQSKGRVNLSIYNKFIILLGGYIRAFTIIIIAIIWQVTKVNANIFLTNWSEGNRKNKDNLYNFLIYCEIGLSSIFCSFLKDFLISRSGINLNKKLHDSMLFHLIKAPINLFHDTIPIGQIINRLTYDLEKSKEVSKDYSSFLKCLCTLIGAIIVCIQYNKSCLILSPLLLLIGYYLTKFYINAGRDLNRLNGINRSPILSLYSETLIGLNTIKAFKKEENLKEIFFNKLDDYFSVVNFKFGSSSFFDLAFDLVTIIFISFILIYVIIFQDNFSPQGVSLLIKYSISFSDEILNAISHLIEIEKSMISIERCINYTKIIQEKSGEIKTIDNALKKSNWPKEGKITFENYTMRYRPNLSPSLNNINLEIKSNEKIGIVGRTGSGKSSLFLSLFRIIESEKGKILIDNIDISQIGLKLLRKSITVIPQEPFLIEGNLRENIDPLGNYTKIEIENVLNSIGLDYLQLNDEIEENGKNLSIGEKQLICIARAILRKSKVVLMDEATASIDYKTETLIQKSIEKVLKFSTVITIAHRIKTIINYDRILVLANGELIEFDTPKNLLSDKNGLFSELYRESAI